MSESWTAVLAAVALLYGPGLAVVVGLRCRTPFRIGLAPAASAGVYGVLGLAFAPLGLRWELAPVLIGVLLLAIAAALLGCVLRRRAPARDDGDPDDHLDPTPLGPVPSAITLLGAAVAALVLLVPIIRSRWRLDSLTDAFDAVFHANAVEFVRADGAATPWTALAGMYGGQRPYYPVSLHLVASLVPGNAVEALNATMLVVLASSGVTMASLLWTVTPASLPMRWRAGVIAACLPMTTLFFSVPAMVLLMALWPNALAAVAFPGVAAAALSALRRADAARTGTLRERAARLPRLLPEALVIGGGVLIHPSIAFDLGVLVYALLIAVTILVARSAPRRAILLGVALVVIAGAYDLAGATILRGMALTSKIPMGPLSGLLTLLSDRPRAGEVPLKSQYVVVVYALAAVGIAGAFISRSRVRLTLAAFAVLAFVIGLGTVYSWTPLSSLANPWYQARERVVPMLTSAVIALAAIGACMLLARVRRRRPRWGLRALAVLVAASLVPAGATMLAPSRLPRVVGLTGAAGGSYYTQFVTPQEEAFIARSARALPRDAVVIGDPADGAAMYWALGDRRVVFPRLGRPSTPALREIARDADELGTDPAVCRLLAHQGRDLYLYRDLTPRRTVASRTVAAPDYYTGLEGIGPEHLTQVASDDDGRYVLYRVQLPC